jgi:hypothetical protein
LAPVLQAIIRLLTGNSGGTTDRPLISASNPITGGPASTTSDPLSMGERTSAVGEADV